MQDSLLCGYFFTRRIGAIFSYFGIVLVGMVTLHKCTGFAKSLEDMSITQAEKGKERTDQSTISCEVVLIIL